MVFLDATSLLRVLVVPSTTDDEVKLPETTLLLRRANRGEVEITTSDAVLAEVAIVLASPAQYGLPSPEIGARLKPPLLIRAFRLPQKRLVLRGLEIWRERPRFGFVDALTPAYAEQPGVELAIYGSDFDALPGVRRYRGQLPVLLLSAPR